MLPVAPAGLTLRRISEEGARLLKYSLQCDNAGEVLASYAPRDITCYPEGNWDYDYGQLPRCGMYEYDSLPISASAFVRPACSA